MHIIDEVQTLHSDGLVPGSLPAVAKTHSFTASTIKEYVIDILQTRIHTGSELPYFMVPSMKVFDQSVKNFSELIVKVLHN